jgi:hypothetical protein
MLAGCARALDKFHAIANVFESGLGEDQAPCLRNFVEVKSDFVSAERCPVTARPDGTGREPEGMKAVTEALIKDADFQNAGGVDQLVRTPVTREAAVRVPSLPPSSDVSPDVLGCER